MGLSVRVAILANDFPRYRQGVRAALAGHTRATAELVATGAKERAPVDTGNLRASIHAQSTGEASAVVGPGRQAPYSIFVHEGTRRMSPRPFLRQAAEAVRPYWEAGLKRILRGGQ